MSVLTPILSTISAFDATKEYKFNFYVSPASDQTVKNRLIIRNNADNVVVYDSTNITFNFFHTLPLNTLINGNTYNAQLSIFNIANTESALSNTILFTCYLTPVIAITNITNNIINSSSHEFESSYSQAQSEPLDSYMYYLYDQNEELLSVSDTKYDDLLKHKFSGLLDSYEYGIELKVKTLHGMEVSTGIITFTVHYIRPNISTVMVLENMPDNGFIKIVGNFVAIEGEGIPTDYTFIDSEYIDLKNGNPVVFNDGFEITDDFTLKIWVKDLTNRATFLTFMKKADTGKNLELVYFDNKIEVYQRDGNLTYYTYSNTITTPLSTDLLYIFLRRKNGLIEILLNNLQ